MKNDEPLEMLLHHSTWDVKQVKINVKIVLRNRKLEKKEKEKK